MKRQMISHSSVLKHLFTLTICTICSEVVRCQDGRKASFYNGEVFQMALKGETTIENSNTDHYTYGKIESVLEGKEDSFLQTTSISLTILDERYLMSKRQVIVLKFKGNATQLLSSLDSPGKEPVLLSGKMTSMQDATLPIEYQTCIFEFHSQFYDQNNFSFRIKGHNQCNLSANFSLNYLPYSGQYYFFIFAFILLTGVQIVAFRRMIWRAREDFEGYMKKASLYGMLMDTTMNSCILYHFGVLIPVDVRIMIPQVLLMINSSFFWMQKLVHSVHNQPNQTCARFFQFLFTIVMMIGGLCVPSLDRRSLSLLIFGVAPVGFQIINSFLTRTASFSWDYNLLFKACQFAVISYIYGWPSTPAHLLPTYPLVTLKYIVLFVLLTVVSYLQKAIHPRFNIKLRSDYARQKLIPKKMLAEDMISEDGKQVECSICLTDMIDCPKETALLTSCGHTYHEACLIDWLKKNENCPLCRSVVVHPDQQA